MKYLYMILLFCFMSKISLAQLGSFGSIDTRCIGLANTSSSVSIGVYSIGINPANLAINQNEFIDFITVIPLPLVSLNTGTNFLSLDDLNYFFGGVDGKPRVLSEADKKRFNSLIEEGGQIFVNASTSLFSFGININDDVGAIAFSIQDIAGAKLQLPHALIDVALYGNPAGKTFNLDDSDIKVWWIRNYSLSYARNIINPTSSLYDRVAFGTTIKLIHGYSYIGTERVKSNFSTGSSNQLTGENDFLGYSTFSDEFGVKYDFDSVKNSSSFSLFPSPAGIGYGFDFGIAAIINNWRIALALTDIGKINWDKNAAEFSAFGEVYFDDLSDKSQLDSLEKHLTGNSRRIDKFSTSLPTTLRVGLSYKFEEGAVPGSLLFALDYNQGFNSMPGNSIYPRISFGTEWKPMDWIPFLRTGISFNKDFGFNWGVGLGIDISIVELHFATSNMQTIVAPNSSKQLSVSFGSRWKFN